MSVEVREWKAAPGWCLVTAGDSSNFVSGVPVSASKEFLDAVPVGSKVIGTNGIFLRFGERDLYALLERDVVAFELVSFAPESP